MKGAVESEAYAKVGEFAYLEVVSLESVGAFLANGTPKDLFLPFREQTRDLRVGDFVIVYLFIDNTGRECASMRTDKYVDKTPGNYHEGDCVPLLIVNQTDLGFRAIIEDRHYGILYANEVFCELRPGQRLDGFIKKVREDGKIDLRLVRTGHKDGDFIGESILAALEAADGFLPLHDKSSAEAIYSRFGISKKKFKMAVGGLLKNKRVRLLDDGLLLVRE